MAKSRAKIRFGKSWSDRRFASHEAQYLAIPRMTRTIHKTAAMLFSLALCACSNAQESALPARTDSAAGVSTAAPTSEPADKSAVLTSTAPTVIYVEATPAEIEAARARFSEEDFAVIADDLMFYRASAIERLEERQIPFTRLMGRRPLEFVIDGVRQSFDFKDVTALDFIVVQLPNESPRTFAPIEIDDVQTYLQAETGQ